MLGSILGASLLLVTTSGKEYPDQTGNLWSNVLADNYTDGGAFVAEVLRLAAFVKS